MHSARFLLRVCLAIAAIGAILLLLAGLLRGLAGGNFSGPEFLAIIGLAAIAAALWIAIGLIDHTYDDISRLHGALIGLVGAETRSVSPPPDEVHGETADLRRAVSRLLDAMAGDGSRDEQRLTGILAALPFPLIAATETGLVSLLNGPARGWVHGHRLSLGASLFGLFDREAWHTVIGALAPERAASVTLPTIEGEPVAMRVVRLAAPGGVVIALPGSDHDPAGGLEQALALHERPPEIVPPHGQTPIGALSLVVLDCETTGLDVEKDRIIQFSAVRAHGLRVFTGVAIDLLIDPQRPIPPIVTKLTGIDAAMLREAAPFDQAWPQIRDFIGDALVIGHNIDFDLAMLDREMARSGASWRRPPSLCTLQLVAALEPKWTDLNLEAIAHNLGVDVTGRHTALGDALVTAAVYARLASRAVQQGITDLAGLRALAATAVRVIRRQQAAGW